MSRILISACLMGQNVRYDGGAKTFCHERLSQWQADGRLVVFCPELAGGMSVPRPPAEIEPGFTGEDVLAGRARVIDRQGQDVTAPFVAGARRAVEQARREGCAYALLTDASPSCGSSVLYSGRHDGARRAGFGVTTAALRAAGILVFEPSEIQDLAACDPA